MPHEYEGIASLRSLPNATTAAAAASEGTGGS